MSKKLCALFAMIIYLISYASFPAFAADNAKRGHAIYREMDTALIGTITGHAGIVDAVQSGLPTYIIHATGLSSSSSSGSGVTGELVHRAPFSEFYIEDRDYYGTYRMAAGSDTDYINAANYANGLIGKPYTFVNQMTANLSGASGTVSIAEILRVRCDGVVEYSFEKAGIEVLGRTVDGLYYWDISDRLHFQHHMHVTHSPESQRAIMQRTSS
ncbi:MAG: hypothetical protein IJC43_03475 [Clostridia bacterium]|nr:hypothetical protein [Clostridia bacterium]